MATPLNGVIRSALYVLEQRGDWGPLALLRECQRIAPNCRHVTMRKIQRALDRRQRRMVNAARRRARREAA